jgi:hypothetical protein
MGHHCGSPLGAGRPRAKVPYGSPRGRRPKPRHPQVSPKGRRLGCPSLGEGAYGEGATYQVPQYKPTPLASWLIHPSLKVSPLWLDSHVWSHARELE